MSKLLPGENLVLQDHPHWITVVKSAVVPVVLLVVVAVADFTILGPDYGFYTPNLRKVLSALVSAIALRCVIALALLGFMGSGKTLVGALVAQRGHATFFDLDHVVEDKAGMSVAEIFATHSEEAFRAFEKETLPGLLRPGAVVALGGGVVMDDDNWRLISESATTVYLEVPFETIWQRIHRLPGRPLIANRTVSEVEAL